MSDKIDEIKRRNYHIAQSDIVWLVAEVERLRELNEAQQDYHAAVVAAWKNDESGRLV